MSDSAQSVSQPTTHHTVRVQTKGLSDEVKKRLKSLILELRHLLEEDLTRELKRLGIDRFRKDAVPISQLSYLTEAEKVARTVLDAVLEKEQAMTGSFASAVEALLRESVYTHLNRLVGLKCLEVRDHLIIEGEPTEAITCRPEFGDRSKWLWTLREKEDRYRYGDEAEELLWREGLTLAYQAVTREIRILFDPKDPYAQVWPSHRVLLQAIEKLNQLPEEAFRADELLGWIYQYFQTEEKDRVFEEARTKKKKITWANIIPVTTLYTERYMVDFLLQNSLGRTWMEMYPDSRLKEAWPNYVEAAMPHLRSPRPVKEWTILDPAVGSGHFLVVAFDLLADLYAEEARLAEEGRIPADWGVPKGEAARTILQSLAREDGYVAMVTQQSWMFLRSFADLRALPEKKLGKTSGQFTGLLRETSIETLAHLGEHGFADPAAAGAFVVLFTLRNAAPSVDHQLSAIRLVDYPSSEVKRESLLTDVPFNVRQTRFFAIPDSPVAYWLPEKLISLFDDNPALGSYAVCTDGANGREFIIRFIWEVVLDGQRWFLYSKGGGHTSWVGLEIYAYDYEDNGKRIKAYIDEKYPYLNGNYSFLLKREDLYGLQAWTFSDFARGRLDVREHPKGAIPGHSGPIILPPEEGFFLVAAYANSRLASTLLSAFTTLLHIMYTDVGKLPWKMPEEKLVSIVDKLVQESCRLAETMAATDPKERRFKRVLLIESRRSLLASLVKEEGRQLWVSAILSTCEKSIDELVCEWFGIDDKTVDQLSREQGIWPAAFPLLVGYDGLIVAGCLIPEYVAKQLEGHTRLTLSTEEMQNIKNKLLILYGANQSTPLEARSNELESGESYDGNGEEPGVERAAGKPPASLLEELAQALKIHPISVYWILEEMRGDEKLVCTAEIRRRTVDYLSAQLLRMLGHRWPMQDQYEKEEGRPFIDPKWVDEDGIIPLAKGSGEETLIERFRRFLDEEFGSDRGHQVETEVSQILGWKKGDEWGKQKPIMLERWFEKEFFKGHVSKFKRRPIAWHLTSSEGAFQCIVYYHEFDRNRLALLRARYVREALEALRREMGKLKQREQDRHTFSRIAELEEKVAEIEEFDRRLGNLQEGRDREARIWCPWKKSDEQPVGWDPDINDGVRVNIAPVQRLGLLAADVLSKKDLNSLLAPEDRT